MLMTPLRKIPRILSPRSSSRIRPTTSRAYAQPKEWMTKIKEKLEQAEKEDSASSWDNICIYKIPRWLREGGGNKAYTPQIVSLGPYHHDNRCLRNMEQHKWRALHHILKRSNQHIDLYIDAVKELEEKARACYEGPIYQTSEKFIEMMILDACFVLEHFNGFAKREFTQLGYSENDPIFSMGKPIHSILMRDMVLLENQIPLFIMDKLFSIQRGDTFQSGEVAELALSFFQNLMLLDVPLKCYGGLHCLEVFRRSLLQAKDESRPDNNRFGSVHDLIPGVTNLRAAGIRFEKWETNKFWEIKFKNGILKIPPLLIQDGTMSMFLNLIAFEQCHRDCTKDITSYVTIMDSLIDSPGDVDYLNQRGIIKNWLGSDAEVAEMFNRLRHGVPCDIDDSLFPERHRELLEEVNRYCGNKWNVWWAILKKKHFNNPVLATSFFIAALLTVSTMVEKIYTVCSYYSPK